MYVHAYLKYIQITSTIMILYLLSTQQRIAFARPYVADATQYFFVTLSAPTYVNLQEKLYITLAW